MIWNVPRTILANRLKAGISSGAGANAACSLLGTAMGRFIAEFGGFYCEWSTVTDSPISPLLDEEGFRKYLCAEYGEVAMETLPDRLARVRETGCSRKGWVKQDLIGRNRAGPDESHLDSESAIVEHYR